MKECILNGSVLHLFVATLLTQRGAGGGGGNSTEDDVPEGGTTAAPANSSGGDGGGGDGGDGGGGDGGGGDGGGGDGGAPLTEDDILEGASFAERGRTRDDTEHRKAGSGRGARRNSPR